MKCVFVRSYVAEKGEPVSAEPVPKAPVETEAQKLAREKREAHNDRIVATFNSVSTWILF